MTFKWKLLGNHFYNSEIKEHIESEILIRTSALLNNNLVKINFTNNQLLELVFSENKIPPVIILAIHHEVEGILIYFDVLPFKPLQTYEDSKWNLVV